MEGCQRLGTAQSAHLSEIIVDAMSVAAGEWPARGVMTPSVDAEDGHARDTLRYLEMASSCVSAVSIVERLWMGSSRNNQTVLPLLTHCLTLIPLDLPLSPIQNLPVNMDQISLLGVAVQTALPLRRPEPNGVVLGLMRVQQC